MRKLIVRTPGARLTATAVLVALGVVACGEDAPPPPPPPPVAGAPAAPPPKKPGKTDGKAVEPADLPALPTPDIQERDFLESGVNRDPFRNFADLFIVKPVTTEVKVQREILVQKHALQELKIVGIVMGSAGRVLAQDPDGVGWVLRVGDFVGKSEVVKAGGPSGGEVAVNWRLDRIRENDVVFVRELPDPTAPATTRVLSLRTQDELRQEIRTGIRGTRPDDAAPAEPPKKGS